LGIIFFNLEVYTPTIEGFAVNGQVRRSRTWGFWRRRSNQNFEGSGSGSTTISYSSHIINVSEIEGLFSGTLSNFKW